MRAGTFNTPITDPLTGQPFPQPSPGVYQIPAGRVNANSVALLNALAPLPNVQTAGFLNYINLNPEINHTRDIQGKITHNITENLRLMAEYFTTFQLNSNPNDTFLGSPYSVNQSDVTTHDQLAQIQLTWIATPSMVNTLSVNMNNYVVNLLNAGISLQSQVPNFQETLPFNGFLSNRLPQITFGQGWAPMGNPSTPLRRTRATLTTPSPMIGAGYGGITTCRRVW